MQNIVIDKVILPTVEVMARVVSMPNRPFWDSQICAVIIGALSSLLGIWLVERWKKNGQEASIRTALKHEIYNNFYEMISMKKVRRIKELLEKRLSLEAPVYRPERILYSEPTFNSFNSMISNNILSAIKREEELVFSLYTFLRQHDSKIKELLDVIDRVKYEVSESFKDPDNFKEFKEFVAYPYDSLIGVSELVRETFEKNDGYLDKISFLNREEWYKFKTVSPV